MKLRRWKTRHIYFGRTVELLWHTRGDAELFTRQLGENVDAMPLEWLPEEVLLDEAWEYVTAVGPGDDPETVTPPDADGWEPDEDFDKKGTYVNRREGQVIRRWKRLVKAADQGMRLWLT